MRGEPGYLPLPKVGERRERRELPREGILGDDPTAVWRHLSGENLSDGEPFTEQWNGERWVRIT